MNTRKLLAVNLALLVGMALTAKAAEPMKFFSRPGSKVRLEGTSNIHNWQVESSLIGGSLEVGEGFPSEPGQQLKPGKIEAKSEPFVTIRSLKSIKEDGSPYNDAMDGIMHGKLKADENPKIVFKLKELTLKEVPAAKDAPVVFEATGDLLAAGESKTITLPVTVTAMPEKKIKVSGTFNIKMTDFKIEPPAPAVAGGLIKTGDEVKVIFDWVLAQRAAK